MSRVYGLGILKSMRIAFRNMFRPPITMQYPHEKWELPERARWAVAMKCDENGDHKCTACIACERACPDHIIKIDFTQTEDRSKHINAWRYEVGGCMMCGLCVEACPYDAILMSHEYELARTDPTELVYNLLEDTPAVPIKRKEPAPAREAAPPAPEAPSASAPAEGGLQ